jgi:hypothetical protein
MVGIRMGEERLGEDAAGRTTQDGVLTGQLCGGAQDLIVFALKAAEG